MSYTPGLAARLLKIKENKKISYRVMGDMAGVFHSVIQQFVTKKNVLSTVSEELLLEWAEKMEREQ